MTDTTFDSARFDSGVINDFRARRDAVRLPSRRAVGGVASLPEMMATYGAYLFFGAVALATIAIIILNMAADAVVDEAETIVKAVSEMYQHQRGQNKAGLSAASMWGSGRLPEKLTDHANNEVWIADGDYPVFFAPGAGPGPGFADPIPATMHLGAGAAAVRYAVIQFGDNANPLPSELCSDIVLAPHIGLVGIAIISAVAGDTKASTSIGTATATPSTTSGHWSVRAPATGATAVNLDELASGQVNLACTGDNKHVALILR